MKYIRSFDSKGIMYCVQLCIVAIFVVVNLSGIDGHGMLMDPVNRGSAWRKGFKTPTNYDDNGNYCGGYQAHFVANKGRCGVCGDNYSSRQPRANENGGRYGTGTIVQTYRPGQKFTAEVLLTTNHWGYFEFALCPLNGPKDIETDECFARHPVKLANGEARYQLKTGARGTFKVDLVIPDNITCEHCSLRWHYKVANSWGICEDGRSAPGCGNQETFRTCSDIKIRR